MTVYIVTSGKYSDYCIEAVFLDMEASFPIHKRSMEHKALTSRARHPRCGVAAPPDSF